MQKSTKLLLVRIKYSMRDVIRDVNNDCASSFDMGKI